MSPRPVAGARLRRVLALVPWILTHPGEKLEALATRFEVPRAELERDLELLPFCGLPPYTADRLIDVLIVDDCVTIRLAEYFDRALRLTPTEGLALLAAGHALLGVPGSDTSGPLATALEKLEAVVGARGGLAVDVGEKQHLAELQRASNARDVVEIDYYSYARDEMNTRRIDPHRVFHAFGAWYVEAWCHQAQAGRLFRVDRIRAFRQTQEHFVHDRAHDDGASESASVVYRPGKDDLRVTIELPPEATWVAESHPVEKAEELPTGRLRVMMAISERAWLERLLLRLGATAQVVAPDEARELAPDAARRLLQRYV